MKDLHGYRLRIGQNTARSMKTLDERIYNNGTLGQLKHSAQRIAERFI